MWISELRGNGEVKPDGSLFLEEGPDLFTGEFLGYSPLSPEEPVAALDWFLGTLPDRDDSDIVDVGDEDLDRRVRFFCE